MERMIVLLRGVNVSGRNKVPMAELRTALADAGFDGAATHIQSGNIALDSDDDPSSVAEIVGDLLVAEFDVDVPVVAIHRAELCAIDDRAPWGDVDEPSHQLLYLPASPIDVAGVEAIDPDRHPNDRIHAAPDALWIHYGSGQSRSKLTLDHLERAAGTRITGRNRTTIAKLRGL